MAHCEAAEVVKGTQLARDVLAEIDVSGRYFRALFVGVLL